MLVTVALMTAVYAIVQATHHGWGSAQVLGFGALSLTLMGAFLTLESRIENPIMPLRILRLRGLIGSSAVRGFLVTGMYSTFFLGTLYLEHVLHYSALSTGLAFLPWTVTVGVLSLGITARLVARFGSMRVLVPGLGAVIIGLGLLSTTGVHTSFFPTIFLAYFAIGLGVGSSFMPLLTIAMSDVPASDAGLGSGIINVSQQVSGALRPRRARHPRHHPLQGSRGRRTRDGKLAGRRLSPRLRDRRGVPHCRDRHGARAAAPARPPRDCQGRGKTFSPPPGARKRHSAQNPAPDRKAGGRPQTTCPGEKIFQTAGCQAPRREIWGGVPNRRLWVMSPCRSSLGLLCLRGPPQTPGRGPGGWGWARGATPPRGAATLPSRLAQIDGDTQVLAVPQLPSGSLSLNPPSYMTTRGL